MNQDKQAVFFALTAVLLWSTVATAFKQALTYLVVYDLLLLSCFWSVFILFIINIWKYSGFDFLKLTGKEGLILFLGGMLNPLAYYLVLFYSYDLLPAQIAQPLNYTWPLMLVILSIPVLRKKPALWDGIALLICFMGILLISNGNVGITEDKFSSLGIFLALFSSILWASYWLIGKKQSGTQEKSLFWNFLSALLILVIMKPFVIPGYPGFNTAILLSTIWIGFFEMGLTFVFWGMALKKASHPSKISHLVYLSPFLSLFWISLILKEEIRLTTILGLIVIISGILLREAMNNRGRQSV